MFYDKFKQLCDMKGVSCNKAALEIGLSNATPTKWKKTRATPDGVTLKKVADYFDVPVDYLLGTSPGLLELVAEDNGLEQTRALLQRARESQKERAPAHPGECMNNDELKFALWGDSTEMDDADLDDVKRYAEFVRQRKREQGK